MMLGRVPSGQVEEGLGERDVQSGAWSLVVLGGSDAQVTDVQYAPTSYINKIEWEAGLALKQSVEVGNNLDESRPILRLVRVGMYRE
jgi:hypothetical protein